MLKSIKNTNAHGQWTIDAPDLHYRDKCWNVTGVGTTRQEPTFAGKWIEIKTSLSKNNVTHYPEYVTRIEYCARKFQHSVFSFRLPSLRVHAKSSSIRQGQVGRLCELHSRTNERIESRVQNPGVQMHTHWIDMNFSKEDLQVFDSWNTVSIETEETRSPSYSTLYTLANEEDPVRYYYDTFRVNSQGSFRYQNCATTRYNLFLISIKFVDICTYLLRELGQLILPILNRFF